jgi:hypothetical protein
MNHTSGASASASHTHRHRIAGWYANQAATPTVAEIMNRHMGFPPGTRAGVVAAEAM